MWGGTVPIFPSPLVHREPDNRRKRNLSFHSSDIDNPAPQISRRTDVLATPRPVSSSDHSHPDPRNKSKEWHLNAYSGDGPHGPQSAGLAIRKLYRHRRRTIFLIVITRLNFFPNAVSSTWQLSFMTFLSSLIFTVPEAEEIVNPLCFTCSSLQRC